MPEPDAGDPTARRYALREHTADVAVEATGPTLGATFAAVADGLAEAHVEAAPAVGERFTLTVEAESREALLFDYLDRLIYERDVRGVLPVEHAATVARTEDGWRLEGSARGVPVEAIHGREVKAVTYAQMALERVDGGWRAYVVFDV